MKYKVIFYGIINGKKQNLDAVFESSKEPKLTDREVIKAVMSALSDVVTVEKPIFSIEYHIEAIVPLV
ncbi:hypothetical protein [Pantoea ananatis]|uniref:hypothetical protein n=1 Tax=Pantoea ananas TaxID=553 RepID=UPI0005C6C418|nr:hypothetical protein [Pantoea ananatis]